MAGKPAPFPTRDEVLRFVRESPGKVGRREIARAFNVRGNDRAALTELLRTLEEEGVLEGRHKRRRPAGTLPSVTVLEVDEIDADGALTARPTRWEEHQPPPPITLDPAPRGVPEPGEGDRVLARLRPAPEGGYLARPMRVLDSGPRRVVGVFRATGSGGGVIEPAERRSRRDLAIPPGETGGARTGELVVGETEPGSRLGLTDARVVERLGDADSPGAISLAAIHAHGLPIRFPDAALAEAERAAPPGLEGRTDLRALPLVTIDGADARDFDDAVWAKADPAPDNPGGWQAVVAIADVAHFVRLGSALDSAARERGNSAYFPDRVVPMLPEALSADLCSLKPGVDRACLAAHLRVSAEGDLRDWRFERALMRSAARLTYDGVQEAYERGGDGLAPSVRAAIAPLYGVYGALRAARERRGALDLELPEREVTLAGDGSVARIGFARRHDSHRLIEELMIAANVAAASALEAKRAPCMYRVHDRPDTAKLEVLREFLRTREIALPRSGAIRPDSFNRFLALLENPRDVGIASLMILRAQAQAAYSPRNIGHYGLGLVRYAHFTSPIRRYADLLVHRALIDAYGLGAGGAGRSEPETLERIGAHISSTERRAQAAERDAGDRYCAAYLADRVDAEFDGRIAGVTRFGIFVSLDETGAEGLVPGATLGTARPRFDARRHSLAVDGRILCLGDPVVVTLREADPIAGGLVFSLSVANGEPWNSMANRDGTRRGRPRRRR
ncbi:MAG: VacB/RNase II family 3'-5' exoribonuclease [Rhodospirillaceae bacterium]|nr:VacB/RNase II family 3'-5' exoribonuclease [Rhodospirillaceae bacterium]